MAALSPPLTVAIVDPDAVSAARLIDVLREKPSINSVVKLSLSELNPKYLSKLDVNAIFIDPFTPEHGQLLIFIDFMRVYRRHVVFCLYATPENLTNLPLVPRRWQERLSGYKKLQKTSDLVQLSKSLDELLPGLHRYVAKRLARYGQGSTDAPTVATVGDGIVDSVILTGSEALKVERGRIVQSTPKGTGRIGGEAPGTSSVEESENASRGSIRGEEYSDTVLSNDQAFQRIAASAELNQAQMAQNLKQAPAESSLFFLLTVVFVSVGFITIIAGVVLALMGQSTASIVAAVSGIIPEATALLFFQKDRELKKTIEVYHNRIARSQEILELVDYAETIQDGPERDKAKREILSKVLT